MNESQNMEAERAAFEAHAKSRNLTLMRAVMGMGYYLADTNEAWNAWLAARRAAPAVGEDGLPPLPKAEYRLSPDGRPSLYDAEQVRQAQRDAVAADRAARAQQQAQSIADDDEFQYLTGQILGEGRNGGAAEEEIARLAAYIDARGRAGAGEACGS